MYPYTAYQGAKTLCIHPISCIHAIWMWDIQTEDCCSLNNFITLSHGLRSTPKTPKSTPDLQRGITVRMAPYAHTQHIKVPKHFVYIQYGCGIQSEACCSLNHDRTTSHGLSSTPIIPKSTPNLQRGITVRVAPYAHTQHIKVPKHFVYIQYGFVIQFEACCSLYHYITTSHGLRSTPKTQYPPPTCREGYHGKGGPICPYTAYQGAKTLCIHPIQMWDLV
jgi:hypothetical protein